MISIKNLNFNFLILIYPLLLITGGFLTGLVIVILGLLFIYKYFRYQNLKILHTINFLNYFVIFILLYLIFLSLKSNYIYESLSSSLFLFRYYFFVLCVCYCLSFNKIFLQKMYLILFSIFIILFIDSIYQFIFNVNIFGFYIQQQGRVSSFFEDELILGSYIVRLLPVLIGLSFYLDTDLKIKKVIIISIIIISLIIILLSGERNSLALFFLVNFLLFLLIKELRRILLYTLITSLAVVFAFYIFNSDFNLRINRVLDILLMNDGSAMLTTYSNIIKVSLLLINNNFLTGTGPELFELSCVELYKNKLTNECFNHPHNYYLQSFTETGLIGFSILFLIFIYLLYEILKNLFLNQNIENININNFEKCLLIAVFLIIWPISQHTNLFGNFMSNFNIFIVALYIKMKYFKIND